METNMDFVKDIELIQGRSTHKLAFRLDAFLRRALDILAALGGLLFLAPFFAVIAIVIRRDSPGPVFYRGPRVGLHGKEFGILKFRTMYECPESYAGSAVTTSGDSRITPLGRWLRDSKINELPQLWNVLVGEMSLVGPRPEDPKLAAEWPAEIRQQILAVRPGITSPASISYRNEENMLSSDDPMGDYFRDILPSKLRLDLLYLRRRTFLSDLDVIFMTFIALFPQWRKGPIPEHFLFNGPFNRAFGRFLNWFVIDWVVSFLSVSFVAVTWRISQPLDLGLGRAVLMALIVALIFSLINVLLKLNVIEWGHAQASAVFDLGLSAAISTAILIGLDHLKAFSIRLPVGMLIMMGIFSLSGSIVVRYRERLLTGLATRWLARRPQANALGEHALIIGAGEMGSLVLSLMKRQEFSNAFSVVGFVDDDPLKSGVVVGGVSVLGSTQNLLALIKKHEVGLVLFAISKITPRERRRIIDLCAKAGVRVVMFPNILAEFHSQLAFQGDGSVQYASDSAEVRQILDELSQLLDQGNIEDVRIRIAELRSRYAVVVKGGNL